MALKRTGGRPLGAREPPNAFSTSPSRYSTKNNISKFNTSQHQDPAPLNTKHSPSRLNGQVKKYISNIENTSPTLNSNVPSSPVMSSPARDSPTVSPFKTPTTSRTAKVKTPTPKSTTRTPSQVSLLSAKFEGSSIDDSRSIPSSPKSSSTAFKNAPPSPSPSRRKPETNSWMSSPSSHRTTSPSSINTPSNNFQSTRSNSPTPRGRQSPHTNGETPTYLSNNTSPLRVRSNSPAHITEFAPLRIPETAHSQARSEAIASSKVLARPTPPTTPSLNQASWETPKNVSSPQAPTSTRLERTSKMESPIPEYHLHNNESHTRVEQEVKLESRLPAVRIETKREEASPKPKRTLTAKDRIHSPHIESSSQFERPIAKPEQHLSEKPSHMQYSKAQNEQHSSVATSATPPPSLNSSVSSSSGYSSYSGSQISRHGTNGSITSASSLSSAYSAIATQPSPKLGKAPRLPPPSPAISFSATFPQFSLHDESQTEDLQHGHSEYEAHEHNHREYEVNENNNNDFQVHEDEQIESPQLVVESSSPPVDDENHEEVSEEYIVNRRRPGSPHCPAPVHKFVDINRSSSAVSYHTAPSLSPRFDLHMDDWSSLPSTAPRSHSAMSFHSNSFEPSNQNINKERKFTQQPNNSMCSLPTSGSIPGGFSQTQSYDNDNAQFQHGNDSNDVALLPKIDNKPSSSRPLPDHKSQELSPNRSTQSTPVNTKNSLVLRVKEQLDKQKQQQPNSIPGALIPTFCFSDGSKDNKNQGDTKTNGNEPRAMPPRPPSSVRTLPTPTENLPRQQNYHPHHHQHPHQQLPSPHSHSAEQAPQPPPRQLPQRRQLPAPKQLLSSQQLQQEQQPIHTCAVCRKTIDCDERVVQTNGVHLHVGCFRCWHCRMQLEHSQFYFAEDTQRLYCHLDYHELFSARCHYCSTPIEGNAIFALDHHWHPGHFFCAQCNKPFKENEDYCILGNTAWCEPCHFKKTALSCWKCKHKLLKGEACIEALGRNWCSSCFCCEVCTEPFQSNEFILREDGTLVCLPCEARRIRTDVWK